MKDRKQKKTTPNIGQSQETPADSDDLGLEQEIPSNYENSLVGAPQDLTGFEVSRSPGRLG